MQGAGRCITHTARWEAVCVAAQSGTPTSMPPARCLLAWSLGTGDWVQDLHPEALIAAPVGDGANEAGCRTCCT
jgi:hypothetical protein